MKKCLTNKKGHVIIGITGVNILVAVCLQTPTSKREVRKISGSVPISLLGGSIKIGGRSNNIFI